MRKVRPWSILLSALVLVACAMSARALSFGGADGKVLYAKAPNWSSDLVIRGYSGHPLEAVFTLSNCKLGPVPEILVAGHGGAVVKDFGRLQCGDDFGLLNVQAAGLFDPTTFLQFNDGKTRTSFEAPVLYANIGQTGKVFRAGGIRNTASDAAYLVLINIGESTALYTVNVLRTNGTVIGSESVIANRGLTFYRLLTPLDSGSITIAPGLTVGCPGCQSTSETYGLVTVGPTTGETVRAVALSEQMTVRLPPD